LNTNSDRTIAQLFMEKLMKAIFASLLIIFVLLGFAANTAQAQLKEPDVVDLPDPKTPLSEGLHNSLGFDVFINNFGFGIGGTYGRVIGPYSELTFRTGITGIRDASEQNFQSFVTGQQIVPNKYKRAFGFPFLVGLKHRVFARHIDDNLRFFVSGAAGPAMAFSYPYVDEQINDGFRTFQLTQQGFLVPVEQVNDFFTGWKDGETHWGYSGEIKIGVDIGSTFSSKTTIEFGYFFYYFKEGLQIMEPYKPTRYAAPPPENNGLPTERKEFFDAQSYFGTPQIKFTFGGMW